jgi:hypothetical protein
VSPVSAPDGGVVRFWCAPGYQRMGFAQHGCYAGQVSGTVTCVPAIA